MKDCEGCKWLMEDYWCDMIKTRVGNNHKRCSDYDSSEREFDPEYFYKMCKKYVEMYDSFKNNTSYMKSEGESFNYGETELLGFCLNDIQREIGYYTRFNLYDILNKL